MPVWVLAWRSQPRRMQGKKQENVHKLLVSLESLEKSSSLSPLTRRHLAELVELVKKDLAKADTSKN
jgi:hypothetical protein